MIDSVDFLFHVSRDTPTSSSFTKDGDGHDTEGGTTVSSKFVLISRSEKIHEKLHMGERENNAVDLLPLDCTYFGVLMRASKMDIAVN